jgi:hypothetical protein
MGALDHGQEGVSVPGQPELVTFIGGPADLIRKAFPGGSALPKVLELPVFPPSAFTRDPYVGVAVARYQLYRLPGGRRGVWVAVYLDTVGLEAGGVPVRGQGSAMRDG